MTSSWGQCAIPSPSQFQAAGVKGPGKSPEASVRWSRRKRLQLSPPGPACHVGSCRPPDSDSSSFALATELWASAFLSGSACRSLVLRVQGGPDLTECPPDPNSRSRGAPSSLSARVLNSEAEGPLLRRRPRGGAYAAVAFLSFLRGTRATRAGGGPLGGRGPGQGDGVWVSLMVQASSWPLRLFPSPWCPWAESGHPKPLRLAIGVALGTPNLPLTEHK